MNPMTWYERTLKTFDPIEIGDDRKKMEELSRELLDLKLDGKRASGPGSRKASTEDRHFDFFGYTLSGEWEDVFYAILYGEGLLNSDPFGFTEYLFVPSKEEIAKRVPRCPKEAIGAILHKRRVESECLNKSKSSVSMDVIEPRDEESDV